MARPRRPRGHKCTERTVDYKIVESGFVKCRVCGRSWHLGFNGWQMRDPEPDVEEMMR